MIWIIKFDGRTVRDWGGRPKLWSAIEFADRYAKKHDKGRGYTLVGFDVDTEIVVRIDKEK